MVVAFKQVEMHLSTEHFAFMTHFSLYTVHSIVADTVKTQPHVSNRNIASRNTLMLSLITSVRINVNCRCKNGSGTMQIYRHIQDLHSHPRGI
jgi:hypothetical protein